MPFRFVDAPVSVRPDIGAAFRREWERLARPGSWWAGAERIAIAAHVRNARYGAPANGAELPPAAVEAAARLGENPAGATREWVESTAGHLGFPRYVELVGVVSRIAAVDTFHVALGLAHPELPEATGGPPTAEQEPSARTGPAWVPMVGGTSIVQALSLVPAEAAAQSDLHGPLYLTTEQMRDPRFVRALTRAQMELVAARTSAVNECFY